MALHAQSKGKNGERELCKWFEKNVYTDLDEPLQRNLLQADGKGTDIHLPDFLVEVKRREQFDLQSWWNQITFVSRKHKNKDLIPIVAFRKNRQKWEFLIPAKLIGVEKGYLRVNEKVFKEFALSIVGSNTIPEVVESSHKSHCNYPFMPCTCRFHIG